MAMTVPGWLETINAIYKPELAREHADARAGLATGFYPLFGDPQSAEAAEYRRIYEETYEQIMASPITAMDLMPPRGFKG